MKALIFDMDGVLFASNRCHALAYETLLKPFSIPSFFYEDVAGMKTINALSQIFEKHRISLSQDRLNQLAQEKTRLANQLLRDLKPVVPGCTAVLAKLSETYRLALASASSKPNVDLFLEQSQSRDFFEVIIDGSMITAGKPDPEIYHMALAKLGCSAEECLVIEDSPQGVQAGKCAGIPVWGILGTADRCRLVESGASFCFETLEELPRLVETCRWTALIPAAGKGSRLGSSRPKILYPVLGKPLLLWLIQLLSPYCHHFVFILSPQGEGEITSVLESAIPGRFSIIIQPEPLGMGEAISRAYPAIHTPFTLAVWGDQVTSTPQTLEKTMAAIQCFPDTLITIPTRYQLNPYIHFERREDGCLSRVLEKREGDLMPEFGENDGGVFAFRTAPVLEALSNALKAEQLLGKVTGDINFLPLFSLLAPQSPRAVITLPILTEVETVGLNTLEDLSIIEKALIRSDGSCI